MGKVTNMFKAAVVGLGWWGKEIIARLEESDRIDVLRGVDVNLGAARLGMQWVSLVQHEHPAGRTHGRGVCAAERARVQRRIRRRCLRCESLL